MESLHESRVAVEAAHTDAVPGQVRHGRQSIEQDVVALVGGYRRDAEQRLAGRGPGCEVGGGNAGLGDAELRGRLRRAARERRDSLAGWSTTTSLIAGVLAGAAR